MDERDPASLAKAAAAARNSGQPELAARLYAEAAAAHRAADDEVGFAHALRHQADVLSEAGDAGAAAPLFDEALALYRTETLPPLDAANAVRGAALNAERLGDAPAARELWREAARRYSDLDETLRTLSGAPCNPGVAEAEAALARLG